MKWLVQHEDFPTEIVHKWLPPLYLKHITQQMFAGHSNLAIIIVSILLLLNENAQENYMYKTPKYFLGIKPKQNNLTTSNYFMIWGLFYMLTHENQCVHKESRGFAETVLRSARIFLNWILTHFPKGISRGIMFKTQVHVQIRGKSLICTCICHDCKNRLNWIGVRGLIILQVWTE